MPFENNELPLGSMNVAPALIHCLLRPGQTAVIAGLPTSGLSTVAFDLGLAVAHGTPWLGERTRKGETAFNHHMPDDEIAARLHVWQATHGPIDPSSFKCEAMQPERKGGKKSRDQSQLDWVFLEGIINSDDGTRLGIVDTLAETLFNAHSASQADIDDRLYFLQRHKMDRQEANPALVLTVRFRPEHDIEWLQRMSVYADVVMVLTTPITDGRKGARELLVMKNLNGHRNSFHFSIRGHHAGLDEDGGLITCPAIPRFEPDDELPYAQL